MNGTPRSVQGVFVPALLLMTGCGRAPSFTIPGFVLSRVARVPSSGQFAYWPSRERC